MTEPRILPVEQWGATPDPFLTSTRGVPVTEPTDEVPLPDPDVYGESGSGYADLDSYSPDALTAYGDARAAHAARRAVEEERTRVEGLLTTHLAEKSGGVYVGCSCGWVVPGGWDHEDHLTLLVQSNDDTTKSPLSAPGASGADRGRLGVSLADRARNAHG